MTKDLTSAKLEELLRRTTASLLKSDRKLESERAARREPIAIVAMACRLPGGISTPEQFWTLLESAGEALEPFPQRWKDLALYSEDKDARGKCYAERGGFIHGAEGFDADFFGILPREARAMDPQQRILLETAWEALERAGIVPASLLTSRTGVYVGAGPSDYMLPDDLGALDGYSITGNTASVLSGRLSYTLGLQGPCMTVDTACSSSLVALHLACNGLRQRECDLALAGGVTVMSSPSLFVEFSRLRALSADGRCKSFSANADGAIWSEACGILVLKRLSDAQAHGDRILAVMRGSAVNHDGRSQGLTAPNGPSQQRVIREALAASRLTAADIDAVEAHGTGTPLGDPIEGGALAAVFAPERAPDRPLLLGSSKSNVGHSVSAAGIVGVMKMVLALQNELLPKTLHAEQPTPHVDWSSGALQLLQEATPWKRGGRVRRAGVSSFGIGGTNAHLVVEEAPSAPVLEQDAPHAPAGERLLPVIVSARDERALRAQARSWAAWLERHPQSALAELVQTAACHRARFDACAIIVASSMEAAVSGLEALADGREHAAVSRAKLCDAAKIAVLFTGQGSQRPGMGRDLYHSHPVFRDALDHVCEALDSHLSRPLLSLIFAEPASPDAALLDRTEYTQPALFALEVALFRQWEEWGLAPAWLAGHSVGELSAAHVSGALNLDDAARLVCARGRAMQACRTDGAMVSIEASEREILEAAQRFAGVSIAALNGPLQTVVSGDAPAVSELATEFAAKGRSTRALRVSHAFHSTHMDSMLDELTRVAATCSWQQPSIPLVSLVHGRELSMKELSSPAYWARQVREPVRFTDGMRFLEESGVTVLLECGPDAVLGPLAGVCLQERPIILSSLRKGDGEKSMARAFAALDVAGHPMRWSALIPGATRLSDLPPYAFQRQTFWLERQGTRPSEGDARVAADISPSLLRLTWERLDIADQQQTQPSRWCVVSAAAPQPVVECALHALQSRGARITLIQPANIASLDRSLDHDATELTGILFLGVSNDAGKAGPVDPGSLSLLQHVVRICEARSLSVPLWILTQAAVSVGPQVEGANPQQALLLGAARTLSLEHPAIFGGLIDLPAQLDDATSHQLSQALSSGIKEREFALRVSGTYGLRLTQLLPTPTKRFHAHSTALITGGSGALAAHVAPWLATRGIARVVLASRRGPAAPETAALCSALEALGVQASAIACDVSDREQMTQLVAQLRDHELPLRVVVHAAGIVDDMPLTQLTNESIARVWRAKYEAALHLRDLTDSLDLDAFVLFSSLSGVFGNPGQASYAGANAALDTLAIAMRKAGVAATSIAWGPWATGMVDDRVASHASRRGFIPMAPSDALDCLDAALTCGEAVVSVGKFDWKKVAASFSTTSALSLLAALPERELGAPEPESQATRSLAVLRELEPAKRDALLTEQLHAWLCKALETEAVAIDANFTSLGLDSLLTLDLVRRVRELSGVVIYPREVVQCSNLRDLAAYISAQMSAAPSPAVASVVRSEAAPLGLGGRTYRKLASDERLPGIAFVISAPRSGSTLLRAMLAGHSKLFSPPELHLLPFESLAERRQELKESYLDEGLIRALMELLSISADEAVAISHAMASEGQTTRDAYRKLIELSAPRLLVDKSPTYAFQAEVLEQAENLFENAKYVHIVRHPYAVIESFSRMRMQELVGLGGTDGLSVGELTWYQSNQNALELGRRLAKTGRYMMVRYEDLVLNPEQELRAISQFLGVPFEPATLTPYGSGRMNDGVRTNSLPIGDQNFLQHTKVEAELGQTWKDIRLPRPLEQRCTTLAEQLGYELRESEQRENTQTRAQLPASVQKTLSVAGASHVVTVWGESHQPTVVCLHGYGDQGPIWEGVASSLVAQGYRVIAPDLRGHGLSAPLPDDRDYRLLDFVSDLEALRDELALDAFVLLAHSMGTMIASAYTLAFPERVTALHLVEPVLPTVTSAKIGDRLRRSLSSRREVPQKSSFADESHAVERFRALHPAMPAGLANQLAKRILVKTSSGFQWRSNASRLSIGDWISRQDYLALLEELTTPTTLMFGDQSDRIRAEDAEAIHATAPTAHSLSIPGSHNVHYESPTRIAASILPPPASRAAE